MEELRTLLKEHPEPFVGREEVLLELARLEASSDAQ